jgi:hypothetical protein
MMQAENPQVVKSLGEKVERRVPCYNLACDQFAISYWRFMGGKGGKRHHPMHPVRNVHCMRNLQSPITMRVSRKPSSCIAGT